MSLVTAFVPKDVPNVFEEIDSRTSKKTTYAPRVWNGHLVIDLPHKLLISVLQGGHSLFWERSNPEIMKWLGEDDRRVMTCNAFPGVHRPPPRTVAVTAKPDHPALIRMRAPDGVTHFSHGGEEHKVSKDGSISVTDEVANMLRSHGFRDAA